MRGSYVARLISRDEERRKKALLMRLLRERGKEDMLIRAKSNYTDKVLGKDILQGQEYDVSEERAKYIQEHGLCEIVVDKKEPIVEEAIKKVVKRNAKSK